MAQRGEEISGIGGDAAGQLPAELSNSGSSSLNLTVSSPNLPEVRDRDIHHDLVSRSASRKAARNGIATLCRDCGSIVIWAWSYSIATLMPLPESDESPVKSLVCLFKPIL